MEPALSWLLAWPASMNLRQRWRLLNAGPRWFCIEQWGEKNHQIALLKKSREEDGQRFERVAELALPIDHPNVAATLTKIEIDGELT